MSESGQIVLCEVLTRIGKIVNCDLLTDSGQGVKCEVLSVWKYCTLCVIDIMERVLNVK